MASTTKGRGKKTSKRPSVRSHLRPWARDALGIGLVVLALVVRELREPSLRRVSMVEAGAVYWHMVDLLWIVLFALLYLIH